MINIQIRHSRQSVLTMLLSLILGTCTYGQGINGSNIKHTSEYKGNGRYGWMVYIDADESTLKSLEYVEYNLPMSFSDTKRKLKGIVKRVGNRYPFKAVANKKYPFAISDEAYGDFDLTVKIRYHKESAPSGWDYKEPVFINYRVKLF